MQIKVNGKIQKLDAPVSIAALAGQMNLNLKQAAVERNREIVPRSAHDQVMVQDGDEIEIVRFIGGG